MVPGRSAGTSKYYKLKSAYSRSHARAWWWLRLLVERRMLSKGGSAIKHTLIESGRGPLSCIARPFASGPAAGPLVLPPNGGS
jgi:hypothetical protein